MRKTYFVRGICLFLGMAMILAPAGEARSGLQPGNSNARGRELAGWQEIYWRALLGDITVDNDANGNAVVGKTVLLPIPNAPGDGTPGSIDITLRHGEGFFCPLFLFLGTSYTDGTPPDQFLPLDIFKTLEITLKIDGKAVVTSKNALDFYSAFEFDPEIALNSPPLDSVIFLQGLGVLHTPLSTGHHTMTLHVKNTIPAQGLMLEYNNTWNITVKK